MLVSIEATNNCNLGCVMCPRELQSHGRGCVSRELFEKVVDECAGLTQYMWLHHMGEPLLNSNIFEMIDYASERGILVGMSSNGTMLTDPNINRLIDSRLHLLIVSIDAVTADTYEVVRKGGRYFDRIERGCKSLLEKLVNKESKMYVSVQLVSQEGNRHECELFLAKWGLYERERVNVAIKPLIDWGSQLDYTQLGLPRSESLPRSCTEPYRTLIIHWNGRVSSCCFDYGNKYNLGDVNTQTIREIWNGVPLIAMRRGLAKKVPVGICVSCSGMNSRASFENEFQSFINTMAGRDEPTPPRRPWQRGVAGSARSY